jgi:ArsR family transcriptional regulator, arsenate/arsenite/antimonite-responsive transcriptional repressor
MVEDRDAVARLSALAHPARLKAFRLLVAAGPSGVPSGEIAEALQVPPTAMSFHLSALERSGLVSARREGRNILYAVQFEEVRELLAFLTEDCCGGRPELCGGPPTATRRRAEKMEKGEKV